MNSYKEDLRYYIVDLIKIIANFKILFSKSTPDIMKCREFCGACCIAPSISSPIPGMPEGKPSGVKCIHLTNDYKCTIFNHPDRPKVCKDFQAEEIICGKNRKEALEIMYQLMNEKNSSFT